MSTTLKNFDGEYVYVIKERENIRVGEEVYKVGFSTDFSSRSKSYPKGSQVQLAVRVTDGRFVESHVLDKLRTDSKFTNRRDVGAEYFEILEPHSLSDLIRVIVDVAASFASSKVQESRVQVDVEMDVKGKDKCDLEQVWEYIKPKLETLSGTEMPVEDMYENFAQNSKKYKKVPKMSKFIDLIKKVSGAKFKKMRFRFSS